MLTLEDSDCRPERLRALVSGPRAADIAGITYRRLDYWVRVGLIEPSRQARGSGTRRAFDARDLADLRLAALLMEVREDTAWAGEVLAKVRALNLDDWAQHHLVIDPSTGDVELDGHVDRIGIVVALGFLTGGYL